MDGLEELHVEIQKLRDAFLESEKQRVYYQELFEQMPEAYIVTDIFGTVLDANSAAVAMLHVTQDRLRGKPLAIYVTQEDRRDFRTNLNKLGVDGGRGEWQAMMLPKAAGPLRTEMRAAMLQDGGGPQRVCWIVRDVK